MSIIILVFLSLFFVIAPHYLSKLVNKLKIKFLTNLVACFLAGAILGQTKGWWIGEVDVQNSVLTIGNIFVLLAIPMLLMVSDMTAFLRYGTKLILSFVLGIVSVVIVVVSLSYYYADLPDIAKVGGAFTAVYTGGTANMVAVRYAVDLPVDLFLILTTTDIFSSVIYFLLQTSIAIPFYGLFLSKFRSTEKKIIEKEQAKESPSLLPEIATKQTILPLLKAIGLAVACIATSALIANFIPNAKGELNEILLIGILTTFSILLSFNKKIRSLVGVYDFAQYLLLSFIIAIGFLADFSSLGNAIELKYLLFNVLVLTGIVFLHLILAFLFKIDRDTYIVTSAAGILGPPFLGQICDAIKNKELLAAGMALGVLGLIIGNYLGIFVYYILK